MSIKILSLSKINRKMAVAVVQFAILLAIAIGLPAFVHTQAITGPIINATLFLSALLLGVQGAMLIGLIPSVVALSFGLLPAPLAPMIPFIMLSNTILILVFYYLKDRNFWVGVISASIIKFLFLFSTSFVVINLIAQKPIAQKVSAILSWPQLVTALAGGTIAFLVLKLFKITSPQKSY